MDMDDHRVRLGRTWPLALAALLAMAPAWARDSLSVKELLDRAQTKPQTQAVEDLIRKLKGSERAPKKSHEPQRPPPATATAEPPAAEKSTPFAAEPPQAAGAEPQQPVPPTAPIAPAPPVPKTEVSEPPPSVDLEVHFDYRSATITPQAVDLLTILGRALSDQRLSGQTFLIAGHTDAKGGAAYNLKLSQARAEAVRTFLIKYFSVEPNRLVAQGHGYRELKNPGMPFASENRRVQVTNTTQQTARP